MAWRGADFGRIAALDAEYAFLEEPDASLALDAAVAPEGAPLVGVKSNIAVEGQAWTAGIGGRRGRPADRDAAIVALLRAAGATFLSRLNMDEAALGAACRNAAFRTTINPAAPGRSAGGSSGGSAAAVAAGAVDVALGTDTLGSVRIPAAYCGVYGLKLGADAVSMEGVFPLAPSLDALGFLGRSPGDIARALDACRLPAGDRLSEVRVPEAPDVAEPVRQAMRAAQDILSGAGWRVGPVDLGFEMPALRADAFLRTEIEASETLAGEASLSAELGKLLAFGARIPEAKRIEIDARLIAARDHVSAVMAEGRSLLLPTVADVAFPANALAPAGQADFTALANVAGLPALAIPMPADGPPVSVQLIGPRGSERGLLALAEVIAGG